MSLLTVQHVLLIVLSLQVVPIRSKTFTMSTFRANYTGAFAHCQNTGLRFATILTDIQNMDFRFFTEIHSKQFVLVSGRKTANVWNWKPNNNSFPISYFDWRDNEPFPSFECLGVRGSTSLYGWYAVPCTSENFFACEDVEN